MQCQCFFYMQRIIRINFDFCIIVKNIWDVNVDTIVIAKLVENKTNSKYLIRCLDKVIRPLVFVLLKMSGYVRTFKVKNGDEDKNIKLISFRIDNEKLSEK